MHRSNIVFCESHTESITSQVMEYLLPEFEAMGYVDFLEEFPGSLYVAQYWLEQFIDNAKDHESKYAGELKSTSIYSLLTRKMEAKSSQQEIAALNEVARLKASIATQSLYQQLESSNIVFQGIDSSDEKASSSDREKLFVEAYVEQKQSFFSRIGLAHALPVQQLLLTQTDKPFLFFYLHLNNPFYKVEKKAMEGSIDYPLGMVVINAFGKSPKEIAALVHQKIIEKNLKMNLSHLSKFSFTKEFKSTPMMQEGAQVITDAIKNIELKPITFSS